LAMGVAPPLECCYFLHTAEGFSTNVYIGNNPCANSDTNYLFSSTTTPIWIGPGFLIETNLVDPPSIAANSSWVTNLTLFSLSITAEDDAVSVGPPATWLSAAAGTNLMVTAFPSNGAIFLSLVNAGPAAVDPPSAIVRVVVTKPPFHWPGAR